MSDRKSTDTSESADSANRPQVSVSAEGSEVLRPGAASVSDETEELGRDAAGDGPPVAKARRSGAVSIGRESTTVSVYRRATWELELLISAALVFSLFQLPGQLTNLWNAVQPTLSQQVMMLPFMLFYLAMLSVYALTIAFTAHFVLRSFWVGVCGLRATFPRGIDWDRFDGSAWGKRLAETYTMPLDDLERLLDRVASGIFAALFAMLLLLVVIYGYTVSVLLLATVLSQWVWPELNMLVIFYVTLSLFVVPAIYVGWIESAIKKKPEREHLWRRRVALAAKVQRLVIQTSIGKLYQPILLTFSTNLSTKVTTISSAVSVFVLVGIFLGTLVLGSGDFGFNSYNYFPHRSGERSVRPLHYDDQLPVTKRERQPLIQSKVIEGPYLELFVPFHVNRDRRNLERACPKLSRLRSEGFFIRRSGSGDERRQAEVLRCLDRIYQMSLDGRTLSSGDWVFYRHPDRGLEGVISLIDVRQLRTGRHRVVFERLTLSDDGEVRDFEKQDDESADEFALRRAERRYVIPFWT